MIAFIGQSIRVSTFDIYRRDVMTIEISFTLPIY